VPRKSPRLRPRALTIPGNQRPELPPTTYAEAGRKIHLCAQLRSSATDRVGRRFRHSEEFQTHTAVIRWWAAVHRSLGIPEILLMHYPAGEHRSFFAGARLKRMGTRAGIPDLHLAVARQSYIGLWIELKSPTGQVQSTQAYAHRILASAGHLVIICRSSSAAIDAINRYLGLMSERNSP
jgi:hypothetical protein